MYHCEIWADADPFCAGADPCIRNFVGHPCYVLGIILLCYQYINLLWPMYSCQIWGDADPFCAGADPCIRNLSDIHAMRQKFIGHPLHVLGTILLCYQYINLLRPMYSCEIWADADLFCAGADPYIRNFVGHPRYVSEICLTSMLCIGNHTTMLPIY